MNVEGKRVTVMGLGQFGGGLGVVKWLCKHGAKVLVTDLADQELLKDSLDELRNEDDITFVIGEHRQCDFTEVDLVIANPAVQQPWNNQYLNAAWNAGVQVSTEIEITTSLLDRNQTIGVTGTCGKSTTSSLIAAALLESGITTHLGGNIGGSLLDVIDSIHQEDAIVLELSSAMLWWLNKSGGWSPHIAVLTTIEENHIDWHGSIEEYKKCKKYIFKYQKDGDIALTQDQDASFANLQLIGKHNERNAAVAFLAAIAANAKPEKARKGIQKYTGLPHRLQKIGTRCYNDSKSTTPQATKLAIDSFSNAESLHVIVGGYDKQIDVSLIAHQANRVKGMYAIGETGDMIASLSESEVLVCSTLEKAFALAESAMEEGDVLLLSPGCASWDQFENYEKRGEAFCALVRNSTSLLQDQ